MNVLIVAATRAEIQGAFEFLENQNFRINEKEFEVLVTGIGGIATTYQLTSHLAANKPGYIIQAGIAGSFHSDLHAGSVVAVHEELMGDMGAEENNEFKDLFDLGLVGQNDLPFNQKTLKNPSIETHTTNKLRLVRSIGINEITTSTKRIKLLNEKYSPDIESMEGAAFHYVCLKENIPFLQIRAVSNYIGERNKENWEIKKAIENLNQKLIEILHQL